MQQLVRKSPVVRLFILGYFSCVIVGWLVLQLPFCQRTFVSGIDTLFTAASAVSTTGLATVDIGKTFSFPGQLALLLLVQLGGIGYMVFSSLIILNLRRKPLRLHRIDLVPAPSFSQNFTLRGLLKQVITYTMICELGGLIVVYIFFRSRGVEDPLWNAIFHTVSAFCTAGFSLFSSNLEEYKNHLGINTILSLLSLMGAFGFFLWMSFFKRTPDQKVYIRLAIRIMRAFATAAIVIGAFLFFLMTIFPTESSRFQKWIISFFQVISAITTAGFNTVDIRAFPLAVLPFLTTLMLVGASLTGSGTDTRGTSLLALLKLTTRWLTGEKTRSFRSKKILFKRTQTALFTFVTYSLILLVSASLLNLIEQQPFLPLFFETASALCTVGFSVGVAPELSTLGKGLIVLLMVVGRTGILILGFALSAKMLSWEQEGEREPAF